MDEFRRIRRWMGRCREVGLDGEIWLDFWRDFGRAVQILLLLCGWSTLTGLAPGAGLAKPTYPPYISSFKV